MKVIHELNCSEIRHLTLTWSGESKISIHEATKLRTLKFLNSWKSPFAEFHSVLFHHLTCLRALDLSFSNLEILPSEVDKLIHLRYIDLSRTNVKELPETVCNLHNLQTLKLEWCRNLDKLPEGLGRLINLRHLMLVGFNKLSYLPQGIGRLSLLHTLSNFIVCGGNVNGGCKIGELKGLKLLEGELEIRGLSKVENENEVYEAELKNKEHIRRLYLYFDEMAGEERMMESVLEGLEPHKSLEYLLINNHLGTKVPNWMVRDGGYVMFNLVRLTLCDCRKWKQLPPTLGRLPLLKELWLRGMNEIKYIGSENFVFSGAGDSGGNGNVQGVFPKLKIFFIGEMDNLEELNLRIKETDDDGRNIIFMPCLQELVIEGCSKLKALHISPAIPLENRSSTATRHSLSILDINDCPKLTWTPPSCCLLFPHLEKLTLGSDAGE